MKKQASVRVVPVVISGGEGVRLWPVSRATFPKTLMRFRDGASLLEKTLRRAALTAGAEEVVVVTHASLRDGTVQAFGALEEATTTNYHLLLEPCRRNTGPALALAALEVQKMAGDDAIVLAMPADPWIGDEQAFQEATRRAIEKAENGEFVVFGINPTYPETGYGYIHVKQEQVLDFTEKPDLAMAQHFLSSGEYLWNAGMFCFSVKLFLESLQAHAPMLYTQAEKSFRGIVRHTHKSREEAAVPVALFEACQSISIDYAVIEKLPQMSVVHCNMGWQDVGSWASWSALEQADAQGNTTQGDVWLKNVSNSYIYSDSRVVAAVGLKDLVVVDTPDALLVAEKNSVTGGVQEIVAQLKEREHPATVAHRRVERPWGRYSIIAQGECFQVKKIEVNPGQALSLQMHYHRSERWTVVQGIAKVTNGEDVLFLHPTETTFIPKEARHRLENEGDTPVILIEVQSGDYLGEDDIVRFDDVYGRVA